MQTLIRSWKVKLVGEGADDAGGVFDDTITEMCRELVDPKRGQNLLVPTPNGFSDTGFNRDKYMPNPGKDSQADLKHYWFVGVLLGIAIRTRKPISLNLAPMFWRMLLHREVDHLDLEAVDLNYARSIRAMSNLKRTSNAASDFFEGVSLGGGGGGGGGGGVVHLFPGGRSVALSESNRDLFADLALRQRIRELEPQVRAVREGMAAMVPVPVLFLMPVEAVERLVCGSPSVPIDALKRVARYR